MTWLIVSLAVVVALVGVAAVAVASTGTASLRRRFGPEYDRVVEQEGDRDDAEAALRDSVKERDALEISDLTPLARDRYVEQWEVVEGLLPRHARRTTAGHSDP